MKEVIITRTLEVYPIGDDRLEFYSWFNNEANVQRDVKNVVYNYLLFKETAVDQLKRFDASFQADLIKLNKKIEDAEEKLKLLNKQENITKDQIKKLTTTINDLVNKRNKFLSQKSTEAFNQYKDAIGYVERTEVN